MSEQTYNPASRCPKCGDDRAHVEWHGNGTQIGPAGLIEARQLGDDGEPGRLLRTCRTCSYQWWEATLDSQGSACV